VGTSRKVRREMQMQARKAFRSATKDQVVLMEYQKRFKDGFDVGFEKGVKATYKHLIMSTDSGVTAVVSEQQLIDMLKEGYGTA